MFNSKKILSSAIAGVIMSSSLPVMAEKFSLEEVIVTAQKRQESIQDVGVSVTAFTGDQMKKLKLTNATDVVAQSPGVQARRHFPSRGMTTNLFIRGVGTTDFNNGTESANAVFVDDFYLVSASTVDFGLFDMERAEVLRGPQGTLFGRNATGGAMQYVTSKPNLEEASGYVETGLGSWGTRQAQGHYNLPITDNLAVRIAGTVDKHDEFVRNRNEDGNGEDGLDQNFEAYRLSLLYKPTDSWDIILKAEKGKAFGNLTADIPQPSAVVSTGPVANLGDVLQAPANVFGNTLNESDAEDGTVFYADGYNYAINEVETYTATAVWEGDNITFTSITGMLDQDYVLFEDCDGTQFSACNFRPEYESKHYSQEFRLNGGNDTFKWTAGFYYLRQDAENRSFAQLFVGADPLMTGDPNQGVGLDVNFNLDVESIAVFGQVEYALTEEFTLIGGLRFNRDTKEFEQTFWQGGISVADTHFDSRADYRDGPGGNVTILPVTLAFIDFTNTNPAAAPFTEIKDNDISGTLQLNWTPDEDSLYYVSFRRGLKAGGFNNGIIPNNLPLDEHAYDKEVLHAYEFGAKLTLLDGTARLNSAIFYYDYQDFQATSFQNLGIFLRNADASIHGLEAEFVINPLDGLSILLGGSWIETEVEGISRGNGGPADDRDMGEAPRITANAMIRYEWNGLGGILSAQVDGSYIDDREGDVLNLTFNELEGYATFNSNIGYESEDGKYSANFWVRNIADKHLPVFRLETHTIGNTGQLNYNERRTAGVTVGLNF